MHPGKYWRQSKELKKWLGKKGTVIASSVVHVAAPDQSALTPYSYVIIDFGSEKREFMGADHQVFVEGDEVECVLRKMVTLETEGLIPYGVKVKKVVRK
jgi:uncharacterized OB-fold protein